MAFLRNCPVCGSETAFEIWFRTSATDPQVALYQCRQCHSIRQSPYASYDYCSYGRHDSRVDAEKARLRELQYADDVRVLGEYLYPHVPTIGAQLLDVGAGDGRFREALPPHAIEYHGIDRWGPYAVDDEFPKAAFVPESFDIVHMRAVLEHLSDPMAYIDRAREVLVAGGVLAVTHVPNARNWATLGSLVIPDEHIVYPDPEALVDAVERRGFVVLDIRFPYYGGPYRGDGNARFGNVFSLYARKTGMS